MAPQLHIGEHICRSSSTEWHPDAGVPSFLRTKILQTPTPNKQVRVEVYKALNGHGPNLRKNSLWVMKIYTRQSGSVSRNSELEGDLRAYIRLSTARAQRWAHRDVGLNFIMTCKATLFFGMGSWAFLTSLAMCNLRAYMNVISDFQVCSLTAQLATGIAALHRYGIIHGDIKPENILVDFNRCVKLTDFGGSYVSEYMRPVEKIVHCKRWTITPAYVAPEKYMNLGLDWWALGCVFYELLIKAHHHYLGHAILFEKLSHQDWMFRYYSCEQRLLALSLHGSLPCNLSFGLLSGLLHPYPEKRYTWTEVVNHSYFLLRDYSGITEFNLLEMALRSPAENPIDDLYHPEPSMAQVVITPQQPDDVVYYP